MNFLPQIGCAFAVILATTVAACSSTNPLYCDERNRCADEDLNFCDIDHAFPASGLANECIARPSAEACNSVERCDDPIKKECSDPSNGVCVECTKNIHCDGQLSCDPRTNECTTETIIACEPGEPGNAQCAGASDELPYCGDEGICVGCLVSDHCSANVAEAICDPTALQCRGCIENDECDSRVCGDGICADEANIVYVDGTEGTDGVSCGTVAAPCATITAGIGQVAGTRDTVLIAEGSYSERIDIANTDLRLRGEGRVQVLANLADSENVLHVTGSSVVDVADMEFGMVTAPGTADAIACDSSTTQLLLRNVVVNEANDVGIVGDNCQLSISRSTVTSSGGVGVVMTAGTLTLHDSTLQYNVNGGVEISNSNYSLVNNVIAINGGPASLFGGVRIEGTSLRDEEFSFNTIAQNSRASGIVTGAALRCELSNVVATSNIFMLEDTSSAALVTGCATQFSLFDTSDTMPVGTGNISAEALFIAPAAGDFHLQETSPGIDAADPTSAIETDIDGEPRPQGDAPDMGADEAL